MDSRETDEQFTIVNRSKEYRISKQLIRKVPYFEKMLSHDLKESKENKVELDFDEKALKWFLNWVKFDYIFIEMEYVINLYNMADYFGIKGHFMKDCITYFNENFTIEHLPVVIPQVTATSKLLNSGALNAFICRYFLKIINTSFWMSYPDTTISYICALDLMVHSEYQVFDAIARKIEKDSIYYFKTPDNTNFNKVRWLHLKNDDELGYNTAISKLKSNTNLASHKYCDCTFVRSKQKFLIMVEKLQSSDLRIKVFDCDFLQLANQVIKYDNQISLDLLHEDHISDVYFASEQKVLRIDWARNKYRWLSFVADYYNKLHKLLSDGNENPQAFNTHDITGLQTHTSSLIESDENFIYFRYLDKLYIREAPSPGNVQFYGEKSFLAAFTVFRRTFILTRNFELIVYRDNHFDLKVEKDKLFEGMRFEDLLLIPKDDFNGGVFLINKSTKYFIHFDISTRKWMSASRMVDCSSADGQKESSKLLTATSAFLSLNTIRTGSSHQLSSKN